MSYFSIRISDPALIPFIQASLKSRVRGEIEVRRDQSGVSVLVQTLLGKSRVGIPANIQGCITSDQVVSVARHINAALKAEPSTEQLLSGPLNPHIIKALRTKHSISNNHPCIFEWVRKVVAHITPPDPDTTYEITRSTRGLAIRYKFEGMDKPRKKHITSIKGQVLVCLLIEAGLCLNEVKRRSYHRKHGKWPTDPSPKPVKLRIAV